MRDKIMLLLFLVFLVILSVARAGTDAIVTLQLNSTKTWWNDSVVANGTVLFANGTGMSNVQINITIDSTRYCTNTSSSTGVWYCTFQSPLEVGSYNLQVNATNSTNSVILNNTVFKVFPNYGTPPIGSVSRSIYEAPMLIQDISGRIRKVVVRLTVWKG